MESVTPQEINCQENISLDPKKNLLSGLNRYNEKALIKVSFLRQPGIDEGQFDVGMVCELSLEGDPTKRIGDINVVKWKEGEYDFGNRERIQDGLLSVEEIVQLIEELVQRYQHRNEGTLFAQSAGVHYHVKELPKEYELKIDPQDYFRLNGRRLWLDKVDIPLKASQMRSDEPITLIYQENRIYFTEEKDPAPFFYIDLKDTYTPEDLNAILEDRIHDAKEYAKEEKGYYLFKRDYEKNFKA